MTPAHHRLFKSALVVSSILVLGATLTAAFWPFKFHVPNRVSWLPEQAGLLFARPGLVRSAGPFDPSHFCADNSVSVELWIKPLHPAEPATILSFYSPRNYEAFAVRQNLGHFALFRYPEDLRVPIGKREFYVDQVPFTQARTLYTVTADEGGTRVYEDGVLSQTAPEFSLRCPELDGDFFIGNSPVVNSGFEGNLSGLAIYNRSLTPAEVKQHFGEWMRAPRADLPPQLGAGSLYLFDEGQGARVHNYGASGPELNLSDAYAVPHQKFLKPFWREFRADRNFAEDTLINVLGFMPLGFCFAGLLSCFAPSKRTLFQAVMLCFLVSLVIEVTQGFMPLRTSGTTDLITNTFGGALGAMCYRAVFGGFLVQKVPIGKE
jgi:VanZ family protein